MKKITLFYSLLLLIYGISVSAEPTLWKIESDKAEVYMFGSIHLGKPEMYPFSKVINSAFIKSEHLVLEIDFFDKGTFGAMALLYLNATLPDNKTLIDVLNEEDLKQLKSALQIVKIPYSSVANLKPWLIGINLQALMMTHQDFKAELGVDIHFAQRALRSKKKVLQLESAAEQFSFFNKLTMEQQITFLNGSVEQVENDQGLIIKMLDLWQKGDQKAFEDLIMGEMTGTPEEQFFYDIFLKQRNIKMAKKIAGYLETGGSYFVVVGAAHYISEDSIIRYLEEDGIKVSIVNPASK